MTEHDPLCVEWRQPAFWTGTTFLCVCDLIAKVVKREQAAALVRHLAKMEEFDEAVELARADERAKALVQAVRSFSHGSHLAKMEEFDEAIAAARAEERAEVVKKIRSEAAHGGLGAVADWLAREDT